VRVLRCIRQIIFWLFAIPLALIMIALGLVFYRWKREETPVDENGVPIVSAAPGDEDENTDDKILRRLIDVGPWEHRCFMRRYITPRTRLPNGQ
jgi:hypothetical protein